MNFRWWIGPWQACPVSCGEGALRRRLVMCVPSGKSDDHSDLSLPDSDCDPDTRPEEVEPCPNLLNCETEPPSPVVVYDDEKTSAYYNVSSNVDQRPISESIENATEMLSVPEILEFDNVLDSDNPENSMYSAADKPSWMVSKWGQCLSGKRQRKVFCTEGEEDLCKDENKPASIEDCWTGKWVTGMLIPLFSASFLLLHIYYDNF